MIKIEPYNAQWPDIFEQIAAPVKALAGNNALALHHIGSTGVPDLAAKDIIDMQLTVPDFSLPFQEALESTGFTYIQNIRRDHTPPGMTLAEGELEKRYFKCLDPAAHLHVRVAGRFNTRYALLCRDYLRATPLARNAYAEIKRQLARYFPHDNEAYYDIKDPVFDVIMAGAVIWAEQTNWRAAASAGSSRLELKGGRERLRSQAAHRNS